jgi:hypothetical protein
MTRKQKSDNLLGRIYLSATLAHLLRRGGCWSEDSSIVAATQAIDNKFGELLTELYARPPRKRSRR